MPAPLWYRLSSEKYWRISFVIKWNVNLLVRRSEITVTKNQCWYSENPVATRLNESLEGIGYKM